MPRSKRRAVTAAVLAASVFFQGTSATAQTYPRTELPGWVVEQAREVNCSATSRYDSGTVVSLMMTPARELVVTVSNPQWVAVRNMTGSIPLTYSFPDWTFTESARKSPDPEPGLTAVFPSAVAAKFLDLWARSPSLIVSSGKDRLVGVSLGGAPAAMTALNQCMTVASRRMSILMQEADEEAEAQDARRAEVEQHNRECKTRRADLDRYGSQLQRENDQFAADRSSLDFRISTLLTFRETARSMNLSNFDDSQQAAAIDAESRAMAARAKDFNKRKAAFDDRIDQFNADCVR